MPRPHLRAAFTMIELLVSITIFIGLSLLAVFVFTNVKKAQERTLSLIQLHTEAAAILQRFEEDLENAQPNTAMNLTPHHATFMRAHGEALGADEAGHGSEGALGYYTIDLVWVRWQWSDGLLRRAISPRWPIEDIGSTVRSNSVDHPNSHGGEQLSGINATPQQFYQYFEPLTPPGGQPGLPDRSDPTIAASTLASQVASFIAGLEGPYVRQLDLDVYWRPNKVWFHPGFAGGANRGTPGVASRIEFGRVTDEVDDGGSPPDVTSITYGTPNHYVGDSGDEPRVAFQVTNMRGYTVNRDYAFLLGVHPDDPTDEHYPTRHGLVSSQALNFRLHALADTFAGGTLVTRGIDKSALFNGDAEVGDGPIVGLPNNPSADNDIASGILAGGTIRPELTGTIDTTQRPTKVEIAFVVHDVPRRKTDRLDVDNDGDVEERMAVAIWDKVRADNSSLDPDVVADAAQLDDLLIRELELQGYVGVAFRHAIPLPH